MRRIPALVIAAALLGLLPGCRSSAGATPGTLSFAQMQSINQGVSAEWLLAEYPFARNVRRHPNGSVAQLGYLVTDPQDNGRSLTLFFDESGVLTRKNYAGRFVRPPIETDAEGNPTNR